MIYEMPVLFVNIKCTFNFNDTKIPSSWKSIISLATMVVVDKIWIVHEHLIKSEHFSDAATHSISTGPCTLAFSSSKPEVTSSKIFLIHFLLLHNSFLLKNLKTSFDSFPLVQIIFLSEAFLGQVLCWTNKHKDCWRRPAKKTGENLRQNIRETFKKNKLTTAHRKD